MLLGELAEALVAAGTESTIRCVVLTGSGKAFAAGADISDMVARGVDSYLDPERLAAWQAIEDFPKPLIAAVNGYALGGGCELAMLTDLIVAAEHAKFGQPEIKIGVIPGDGGTQRLPRMVGHVLALRMILTGELIGADDAARAGLVAEVVPGDQLLSRALDLAETIAKQPPVAARAAKKAVRAARELPLSQGLFFERELVRQTFATEDRAEGMRAFTERRTPMFKGR